MLKDWWIWWLMINVTSERLQIWLVTEETNCKKSKASKHKNKIKNKWNTKESHQKSWRIYWNWWNSKILAKWNFRERVVRMWTIVGECAIKYIEELTITLWGRLQYTTIKKIQKCCGKTKKMALLEFIITKIVPSYVQLIYFYCKYCCTSCLYVWFPCTKHCVCYFI